MEKIDAKQQNAPKKKIGLILAMLVMIAAVGAGAYYLGSTRASTATAATSPQTKLEAPIFIAMDPFTVNLRQDDRNRFLHIAMTVKVLDSKTQTQLTEYLPEARSRVLTVLANRQLDSLNTAENKKQLSTEILNRLSQPFTPAQPKLRIADVLFTTFIVQ